MISQTRRPYTGRADSVRRSMPWLRLGCLLVAFLSCCLSVQAESVTPPLGRPKVCLVLAGGGAKGIAHVGVIKVLHELRVPIDCIVGTSMGSIVGAAYASGNDPQQIESIVSKADWDRLLSDQPDRAERSTYTKSLERSHAGTAEVGVKGSSVLLPRGVLAGQQLQPFLQSLVRPGKELNFDELAIPFRAVATDFETGQIALLSHGDLAMAIRASMSVPGAFAPVEYHGQLLVDGGLVRNLPIDLARSFKPDVIIAVDLGDGFLKRSQINSVLSVGLQTISILMAQNSALSLSNLKDGDILIRPDVADIDSADFAHSLPAIERGQTAANAVASQLKALSVSEEAYAAWERHHDQPPEPTRYARVVIDTSQLKYVNPQSVQAIFNATDTQGGTDQLINQLLATDDFERIDSRAEPSDQGFELVLTPVEKSWGPNYLRLGMTLGADLGGGSDFTVFIDHRATWLTDKDLEWRNHISIGRVNSLASELRQPLDPARNWFVQGLGNVSNAQRNLYVGEFPVAIYRLSNYGAAAGIGRNFGNWGEMTLGIKADAAKANFYSGLPLLILNNAQTRYTGLTARYVADTLDNLDFPKSGHQLRFDSELIRPTLGASGSYNRVTASVSQAFGYGPASIYLTGRVQSSAGSSLPIYRAFELGGFLNLSGLREDQLLANRVDFVRAIARTRVASAGSLLPGLFIGASLEGANVRDRVNPLGSNVTQFVVPGDLRIGAGSLFLSAESALGPFYLALGHSRAGQNSLYFYIGRP